MMEFLDGDLWTRLKAVAKDCKQPAHAAVAYFGKGAARLLPLPEGSRLVVDASEHAVKCGLTHPDDLATMVRRGVQVYSIPNLHAKGFVLGRTAFVGSNNASHSSTDRLVEAAVATTDAGTVKSARAFVRELCLDELGPEELKRLQQIYRPPRVPGGKGSARNGEKKAKPILPRTMLAQLHLGDPPEGSVVTQESGRKAARKRLERPRQHILDDFWYWGRCPYNVGDIVVQVVDKGGPSVGGPTGQGRPHPQVAGRWEAVHVRVRRDARPTADRAG